MVQGFTWAGFMARTAGKRQIVRRFPFDQRASLAQNPTGRKLFELMARKQSNLAVAADVPTVERLLELAEQVGSITDAASAMNVNPPGCTLVGLTACKQSNPAVAADVPTVSVYQGWLSKWIPLLTLHLQ